VSAPLHVTIALLTGVFSGIISFLGLYAGVYLFSHKFEPKPQPPFPLPVLFSALILKFPALIAGWLYTRTLGTTGPLAFGLGIVLVYSLAVVRATLKSQND
jgi:hypothetical protein